LRNFSGYSPRFCPTGIGGREAENRKQVSRCNALRLGLTAETVISALEDAEDYKAFEAAITADYDAQSAVERELVLSLASLLWRLRRATTMETGLFEIQAEHLRDRRERRQLLPDSRDVIHAVFQRRVAHGGSELEADTSVVEFAHCFFRLANLPNFALDRLSAMKQPFGARPAEFFPRSRHSIAANHKSEHTIFGLGRRTKLRE
jgi:hypothetical protein